MLTVDQLMTKSLVNIEYGRSAIEAAKLMKTHKVGSVFVQKDNRIIGIVTEPDIIRKVVGAERVPYYVPVEEIMSSPVIGIDWRRPITEAADMMEQYKTRHLAVLNGWVGCRDSLSERSLAPGVSGMNFEQSNDSTMERTIMFDDSLTNIIASSLELATGAVVVYFLYSIWRDIRNALYR